MSEELKTRIEKLQAKNDALGVKITTAKALQTKGYSNVAIAKALNMPESSVRALLKKGE